MHVKYSFLYLKYDLTSQYSKAYCLLQLLRHFFSYLLFIDFNDSISWGSFHHEGNGNVCINILALSLLYSKKQSLVNHRKLLPKGQVLCEYKSVLIAWKPKSCLEDNVVTHWHLWSHFLKWIPPVIPYKLFYQVHLNWAK